MGVPRVVVWLTETTWKATIDATTALFGDGVSAEVVLLHVADSVIDEVAHGAFTGLPGRASWSCDPGDAIARIAAQASQQLLDAARHRLGRPALLQARTGHVEGEVAAAAEGADLLVCARDGDHRLGPHSLGRATRSVVDHAPCAVLLIWPDNLPDLDPIPPTSEHLPKPPAPPHP